MLTDNVLLFGSPIQMGGSVKRRKAARHAIKTGHVQFYFREIYPFNELATV